MQRINQLVDLLEQARIDIWQFRRALEILRGKDAITRDDYREARCMGRLTERGI